jgi:hypothetical protein
MNFIDDIHLVISNLGWNPDLFNQVADIFHRIIGSGIQFMDVEGSGTVKRQAGLAFVAGFYHVYRVEAIDSLGKDTGACRLANPSGAAKQECLSKLAIPNGIF